MLNKIKFSYKVADSQDGCITSKHTKFKCKIKFRLQYTFNYQCNTSFDKPNLKDCLDCLLLDASSYEQSRDVIDFCNEFGYEDKQGLKAYKGCKKTYKALHRLFTEEEFDELCNEIEGN